MRFPVSDHCDGTRFFNPGPSTERGLGDLIRWQRTRASTPWPPPRPALPVVPPPARAEHDSVAATWIGHSTFLIQTEQTSILTDPVFTSHAGPIGRFGPRRSRPPALTIAQLPAVDLVLVSHNHYDHLQPASLREVERRFHPTFVTTLGTGDFLRSLGLQRVVDLDWWSHISIEGTTVTCTPARHFSARGLRDRNRNLWGGFLVRDASKAVYFAGDTGYATHFTQIAARLGPIDAAFIPIGAYEPRWFMAPVHVNPAEAVRIHLDVAARVSVAMHFGTFKLTDEGIDAPPAALVVARAAAGIAADAFRVPQLGETMLL